jgi:hypothetical protein
MKHITGSTAQIAYTRASDGTDTRAVRKQVSREERDMPESIQISLPGWSIAQLFLGPFREMCSAQGGIVRRGAGGRWYCLKG